MDGDDDAMAVNGGGPPPAAAFVGTQGAPHVRPPVAARPGRVPPIGAAGGGAASMMQDGDMDDDDFGEHAHACMHGPGMPAPLRPVGRMPLECVP